MKDISTPQEHPQKAATITTMHVNREHRDLAQTCECCPPGPPDQGAPFKVGRARLPRRR